MLTVFNFLIWMARFVIPGLVWIIKTSTELVMYAATAWFRGYLQAIRELAHFQRQQAAMLGWPTELDTFFDYAAYIIVIVELTLGWILASYLTVMLVNAVLFHR